jgi:hypothetical protein
MDDELVAGLWFTAGLIVVCIALIVIVTKLRKRTPLGKLAQRRGWKYDGSRFSAQRAPHFSWYGGGHQDSETGQVSMVFHGHLANVQDERFVVLAKGRYEEMAAKHAAKRAAFEVEGPLKTVVEVAAIGAAVVFGDGEGVSASSHRTSLDFLNDESLRRCDLAHPGFASQFAVLARSPARVQRLLSADVAGQLINWARLPSALVQLYLLDGVLTIRIDNVRFTDGAELERFIGLGERLVQGIATG